MLLTRKSATAAVQPRLAKGLQAGLAKIMDRRTFLKRSGVTAGAAAVAAELPYSMIGIAEGCGGGERRLDQAGAGVRFADQSRRALRQGRLDPRARHDPRLAPPQVS